MSSTPFYVRTLNAITNAFHTDQETLLAVLLTVVLVLVTGIYLLWDTTNADLEQTIVLVGSSGAGKTSIFAKSSVETETISTPFPGAGPSPANGGRGRPPHLAPKTKKFKIIDYPGHARLAGGLRGLLEKEVRGKKRVAVVFVVDGSGSGGGKEKDVGGVVDALLPLLPYTQPHSSGTPSTPLLLLSSKLDLLPSSSSRSLSVPRLHTSLTRELNARRSTAFASSLASTTGSATIQALDDDGTDPSSSKDAEDAAAIEEILLRGAGQKWRWEDWKGVSWAGGWVGGLEKGREKTRVTLAAKGNGEKDLVEIVGEDGLGELKEWLWNLK